MAIKNYNAVIDALTQFANAHLTVKRFKTSFFTEIDNFATAENSFPILYAIPNDVEFSDEIDIMSFRIYCCDILKKDRSNESSILNETLLVLRDLVNWIRNTDTLDLNVVGTPLAIPVNNFLTEFTVGFFMDIAVETSPETNECSIPFSTNFQYSGLTICDYTYISPFLTCDTLDSCATIINLQNQINALTGNSTTDYYVTGGTYSNGTLTLNRQNGQVTIPGFLTGTTIDTYVTGFTYNNANRLTISQNQGQAPLNVFINTFSGLTTDYVDINTAVTIPSTTGRLHWNDVDGTVELGLKGGVVRTQIGQGLVTRVVNKTVPNIDLVASNYQIVVVSGAQGQRLAVKLAQANNDANSAGTLGIVAENIAKNQEGFIVTVGLLKDINTTGNLQGETWNDGDVLYLSPTTAGAITNIKPQAPNHTVIVGYVEYSHPNNGKIYVKIDNGYELDELHNVRISGATNNQVLSYNSTANLWENRTLPNFITGFTDTFTTGFTYANNVLTINQNQGQVPLTVTLPNFITGFTDTNNFVTGGTFASTTGILTLNRQDGSVQVTGLPTPDTIRANVGLSVVASNYVQVVNSGNTTSNLVRSLTISANTFSANQLLHFRVMTTKNTSVGAYTVRAFIHTGATAGGIQVLTTTTTAGSQQIILTERNLHVQGSNTILLTGTQNALNEMANSAFTRQSSAIDWTQTQFLNIFIQNVSATDNVFLNYAYINRQS